MNKCIIYDEDSRAQSAHYKSISEKKEKGEFRGNPYVALADKGKQKTMVEKKPSGGGAPALVQCYRCDMIGHCANE